MITITVENNMLVVDGADVLIDHAYMRGVKGKAFCSKRASGISGLPVIKIDGSVIDKFDGVLSNNGIEVKNLEAYSDGYHSVKGNKEVQDGESK